MLHCIHGKDRAEASREHGMATSKSVVRLDGVGAPQGGREVDTDLGKRPWLPVG